MPGMKDCIYLKFHASIHRGHQNGVVINDNCFHIYRQQFVKHFEIMRLKKKMSKKSKLFASKMLLCIPVLLLINYQFFPQTVHRVLKNHDPYFDVDPDRYPYIGTGLKVLPVSHYIPDIKPFLPWGDYGANIRRKMRRALDSMGEKTQPIDVSSRNDRLYINAKSKRLLFHFEETPKVQVDSPELEKVRYDRLNLRNSLTHHRPVAIKGFRYIAIGGQHDIEFSSKMNDTVPDVLINFDANGDVLVKNCIFTPSHISTSSAAKVSVYSSGFYGSAIDLNSAASIVFSENTMQNSSIKYHARSSNFQYTTFLNTTIESAWSTTDNFGRCSVENVRFKRRADSLSMKDVEVIAENKFDIGAYTTLENIKGPGILDLNSVYEPSFGLQKGIQEFVDQGGTIRNLKKWTKSVVVLSRTNLSNLRFDPTRVFFIVDTSQDYLSQERTYLQLIEYFKFNDEERREYDVQYRRLKRKYEDNYWGSFKDSCQELWNDYGYDNGKIWVNAAIVFLIFFTVNLFLFPKIILNGYMLDGFSALNRKNEATPFCKRLRFEVAYSLLFTLLLFWIVSIDWGKLKIKNFGIACWIIIQYAISLLILTLMVKSIFD